MSLSVGLVSVTLLQAATAEAEAAAKFLTKNCADIISQHQHLLQV
jgi:hypothetical protein